MGIRAKALTDYKVASYRDQSAVISLLAATLPALRAVADYWKEVQPDEMGWANRWTAYLAHHPNEEDYLRYDGPAGFSVEFGERVAQVSGPCRWSGFCTIQKMQEVHTSAFRNLARALGGRSMILLPDYDPVEELARYSSGSLDECRAFLEERWGPPHPRTEIITTDVQVLYGRKFPAWFVEEPA